MKNNKKISKLVLTDNGKDFVAYRITYEDGTSNFYVKITKKVFEPIFDITDMIKALDITTFKDFSKGLNIR